MKKDVKLISLQSQLRTQHTDLNNYNVENIRLQSSYDAGILRIQQLEQQLNDVLYYKRNMLEKMQEAESLVTGEGSRLGGIKFFRHGLLEGRFLERMQTRISEQHRTQAAAVEAIRENIWEIKRKVKIIENEIEAERRYVIHVDSLISTNQAKIQQKKMAIAQLESSIRVLT